MATRRVGRPDLPPGKTIWRRCRRRDWNYDRAAHLLAHAGFGGTPAEIQKLADAGLDGAVRSLVHYEAIPNPKLQPFVESGLWDPSLNGFPESRPEATDRAAARGESMGVATKPAGSRPVQPVSDRFFYWLRATMLETRRLGYWWANRMLQTTHPVEEKMALLWHGHFATHENKVRDYRKMVQQIDLFERGATGNLRDLTIGVAQNPAMLYFLDAQYNVKGAPNENFAREVMELFTMGVGNYTEKDVRECARAFTGWYFDDLAFKVDPDKHDDGVKTFLGRTGNFDGVEVLRIIFEQPVTAEFFAGQIYRFLVRDELSPELRTRLGTVLRDHDYEVKPLLTDDLLVEGLLQPGQLRRPHQGAGRAPGRDAEAAGRRRRAGRARLQPVDHRHGPAPAEPAVGGRLGRRPGLDHAGPADGARQRRPRRADSRHDRLPRLELHRRHRTTCSAGGCATATTSARRRR